MMPHTPGWKLALGFVVMLIGAAISIPLGAYAERDDAPGGVVIAFLVFVASAVLAISIVKQGPEQSARK
jgi:hypothetical protein